MSVSTDYNYYNSYYYTQRLAQGSQKRDMSSVIDKDKDKTLSSDELSGFAAEFRKITGGGIDLSSLLDNYDSDGDGALSESEQSVMNEADALEQLMAEASPLKNRLNGTSVISGLVDRDSDSLWSSDELTKFVDLLNEASGGDYTTDSIMSQYDADGDGTLNVTEQEELLKGIVPPPPPPQGITGLNGLFPSFADTESENELTAVSAVETDTYQSEADIYAALRQKVTEIYEMIQESLANKEEELRLLEETDAVQSLTRLAYERRAAKTAGAYEQSMWYSDFITNLTTQTA